MHGLLAPHLRGAQALTVEQTDARTRHVFNEETSSLPPLLSLYTHMGQQDDARIPCYCSQQKPYAWHAADAA